MRPTGRQRAGFPVLCNTPLVLAAVRHTAAGRNRQNPGASNLWRSESILIQAPLVVLGSCKLEAAWLSLETANAVGCLQEEQSFNGPSCGFAWRAQTRQWELHLSSSVMVHTGIPISMGRLLQVLS